MRNCSLTRHIKIEPGSKDDYFLLRHYHYRDTKLGPFVAIYRLIYKKRGAEIIVGVIVYTMPSPNCQLRALATGDFFTGLDRRTRLAIINSNFRCISRVIIEPRFRSLGLAVKLVCETINRMEVAFVEALAVMGNINPFFEKAGMKAYHARPPARCMQLIEAFSTVGVESHELIDPEAVQKKLDVLNLVAAGFIERQIGHFLQSYSKRRFMATGIERTRFILSKLTDRPVYYLYKNKNSELRI